jgi:hypothetical protein
MRRTETDHANDVVLQHISRQLGAGSFNGQIILHVNAGVIRKTETRDFVSTETLLSKGVDRNGSGA